MSDILCIGIIALDIVGRPIRDTVERGRLVLLDNLSLHLGGCASTCGYRPSQD